MTTRSTFVKSAALAVALGAGLLSGCTGHKTGGNQRSEDMFVYESSAYLPVSIDLIDTRTDETFWSMDVPVGQKLVIRFYEDKAELASSRTPDLMRWELYDADRGSSPLRNAISAPPFNVRRIDVSLRETPEYPPENDPYAGIAIVPDPPGTVSQGTPTPPGGRSGTYYADRWAQARAAYQARAEAAQATPGEPTSWTDEIGAPGIEVIDEDWREGVYYSEVEPDSPEGRAGVFYSDE